MSTRDSPPATTSNTSYTPAALIRWANSPTRHEARFDVDRHQPAADLAGHQHPASRHLAAGRQICLELPRPPTVRTPSPGSATACDLRRRSRAWQAASNEHAPETYLPLRADSGISRDPAIAAPRSTCGYVNSAARHCGLLDSGTERRLSVEMCESTEIDGLDGEPREATSPGLTSFTRRSSATPSAQVGHRTMRDTPEVSTSVPHRPHTVNTACCDVEPPDQVKERFRTGPPTDQMPPRLTILDNVRRASV